MSDAKRSDVDVFEKEVAGEYTSFRIYLFMLKKKESTPREAYAELCLSSPSLAVHHFEKLERIRLLKKDEWGKYSVIPRRFGILRFFVITGKWLIPRTFFYVIFFILISVGSFWLPTGAREVALILSLISIVTNLVETVDFYRVLYPVFKK